MKIVLKYLVAVEVEVTDPNMTNDDVLTCININTVVDPNAKDKIKIEDTQVEYPDDSEIEGYDDDGDDSPV